MKYYRVFLLFLFTNCIFGCISSKSYTGVKPVYPPLQDHVGTRFVVHQVDGLQPEFRWEDAQDEGTTYDLVIFEAPENFGSTTWTQRVQCRKSIYYVENIRENYHRISQPLNPNSCYCWSVRKRRGNLVGVWSKYASRDVFIGGSADWANVPFLFKTP